MVKYLMNVLVGRSFSEMFACCGKNLLVSFGYLAEFTVGSSEACRGVLRSLKKKLVFLRIQSFQPAHRTIDLGTFDDA